MNASHLIHLLWYVFWAIWLAAAFISKRTVQRQNPSSRWLQGCLVIAGLLFLFLPLLRVGIFGWRLVPISVAANALSIGLAVAGCLLALWARVVLGRNWSGVVTLKQDHTLILTGPYRFARHPIYSGILLLVLGTAVVFGDAASFLALGFIFLGFWSKLRIEESFMQQQFGEQYVAYKHRVKALIPGIF